MRPLCLAFSVIACLAVFGSPANAKFRRMLDVEGGVKETEIVADFAVLTTQRTLDCALRTLRPLDFFESSRFVLNNVLSPFLGEEAVKGLIGDETGLADAIQQLNSKYNDLYLGLAPMVQSTLTAVREVDPKDMASAVNIVKDLPCPILCNGCSIVPVEEAVANVCRTACSEVCVDPTARASANGGASASTNGASVNGNAGGNDAAATCPFPTIPLPGL